MTLYVIKKKVGGKYLTLNLLGQVAAFTHNKRNAFTFQTKDGALATLHFGILHHGIPGSVRDYKILIAT